MRVVAFDPGATTGVATLYRGAVSLRSIASDDYSAIYTECVGASVVVIERPVIYPGGRTRNPNAVLDTAIRAGEIAGAARGYGCSVVYVTPREWGGAVPKKIKHRRVVPEAEKQWTIHGPLNQHTRDALGMLLWWKKAHDRDESDRQ